MSFILVMYQNVSCLKRDFGLVIISILCVAVQANQEIVDSKIGKKGG